MIKLSFSFWFLNGHFIDEDHYVYFSDIQALWRKQTTVVEEAALSGRKVNKTAM
jgi:hypothetical protein